MNAKRRVSFARALAGQETLLLLANEPEEPDGSAGPSLMISSDIRSEAGFAPALVFSLQVPKADPGFTLEGRFSLMRGDDEEVVAAKRCIAWILHPGPREAIDIEFADRFGSLATDAATLYKLFFSLSLEEDEEALLKLPVFRIGDSTFKVPALAVFRLGASEKLLFVALPS